MFDRPTCRPAARCKIHALHMLQLYHREISCRNKGVGWKHEKQTSLVPLGKHELWPYVLCYCVMSVYGIVSLFILSFAEVLLLQ